MIACRVGAMPAEQVGVALLVGRVGQEVSDGRDRARARIDAQGTTLGGPFRASNRARRPSRDWRELRGYQLRLAAATGATARLHTRDRPRPRFQAWRVAGLPTGPPDERSTPFASSDTAEFTRGCQSEGRPTAPGA
jgi:hypothetical protein